MGNFEECLVIFVVNVICLNVLCFWVKSLLNWMLVNVYRIFVNMIVYSSCIYGVKCMKFL